MPKLGSAYFDTELRVGYARVAKRPVAKTVEYRPAVLLDLSEDGSVVGLEVLNRVHQLPVSEMATDFKWDAETWRAVHNAARDLEGLMQAHPTTGADGVYRTSTSWTQEKLVGA